MPATRSLRVSPLSALRRQRNARHRSQDGCGEWRRDTSKVRGNIHTWLSEQTNQESEGMTMTSAEGGWDATAMPPTITEILKGSEYALTIFTAAEVVAIKLFDKG